jgi:ribosomal protein S18 acetylase RimI-like enzyme
MTEASANRWRRLRVKLDERGPITVLREGFRNNIYRKTISLFLARDTALEHRPYRVPKVLRMRHFTADDLPRARKHFADHTTTYARLLSVGCIGIGAFSAEEDGELVGIGWFAVQDFYDAEVYRFTFEVEPDEVYQFAAFLSESHRNTAVSGAVVAEATRHFRAMGRRRMFGIVDAANTRSLRWHQRLGYREMGRRLITYRGLGITRSHAEPYSVSLLGSAGETPTAAASPARVLKQGTERDEARGRTRAIREGGVPRRAIT